MNSPSFSHQYELRHGSLAVKHRRRKPAPYTEMALVLFMRLFVHISFHLMKESVSPVVHPESASPASPSASSGSCSSDGRCTRCSSIRLAWTLCMRLKKSSSGTVGARGPPSGGEQRWSSILEDWTNRETATFSCRHKVFSAYRNKLCFAKIFFKRMPILLVIIFWISFYHIFSFQFNFNPFVMWFCFSSFLNVYLALFLLKF